MNGYAGKCAYTSPPVVLMLIKNKKGLKESFNALEPTRVGAFSSAVPPSFHSGATSAVHVIWSRMPELWTLAVDTS